MDLQNWIIIIAAFFGIITPIISTLVFFITSMKRKGKYEQKVENNETNITHLRDDIKEVRSDLKIVNQNLSDIPWRITNAVANIIGSKEIKAEALTTSQSPIALSDKGEEIAKNINSQAILSAHKKELQGFIDEKKPDTAYQIQECAKDVIENKLLKIITEEEKKFLEDFAFKERHDLETFFIIFSIQLRDMILAESSHTHEDIDKTSPTPDAQ